MTDIDPESSHEVDALDMLLTRLREGDVTHVTTLRALLIASGAEGSEYSPSGEVAAPLHAVATAYRNLKLAALQAEGRDIASAADRLHDEDVRQHLATVVLPAMAADGMVQLPADVLSAPDAMVRLTAPVQALLAQVPAGSLLRQLHELEEQRVVRTVAAGPLHIENASELSAEGLVKMYKSRRVVNDVAIHLRQGEIVGLLGPNGAGKTTTFYMIVGLIAPMLGRIILNGEDITRMPMYKRAQRGIGYLAQEPSIFRKLSVEDNILAILETLDLTKAERHERLELLLDELKIKHLRRSKAFQLSGGERRRLEITRALVTEPKFMMLDEPFAGVDPIAVDDIQKIVAQLRYRGIGVLISDHNVEQTLDIVDRAYIMYDGQVKYAGTVRDLVFDDSVSRMYLGPTLTARLRARFAEQVVEHVAEAIA